MSAKRTELAKSNAKKITGNMKLAGIPDRFGKDAGSLPDKREQRKRDQELGLIPFAIKLHGDLIKQLQAKADADNKTVAEVTTELLQKALAKK
jgi:hypothetical protein